MNVKEMQQKSSDAVNAMDEKMKAKHDVDTTFVHLVEEKELEEEFADTAALLMHLAALHDVDMEKSFVKRSREWKKRNG